MKKRFLLFIIPFFVFVTIRILRCLCKVEYKVSQESLELLKSKEGFIFAFWHGELLFQPLVFSKYSKDKKAFVLISHHFDGEIISRSMSYFGLYSLRGSSSRGGSRALLEIVRKLKDNNIIAITPDGPRGPYHSVANGIVLASQKSNAKILISKVIYSNAWELGSWDRFKIPKPFSKVTFYLKDPILLESLSIDKAKEFIKEYMEFKEVA